MPLFKSDPVVSHWLSSVIGARDALDGGDFNVALTILKELEDALVVWINEEEAA